MTKIIITGCNGRMGQMITDIVTEDNDAVIVAGVDIVNNRNNSYPVFTDISDCDIMADVIIDVSSSQGIEERISYAVDKHIPVIVCSTGMSDSQIAYITEASKKVAVLKSANMSLGINLLMKLVKEAAKRLADNGFDIEIIEKHHNVKKDAPSGTAYMLAESVKKGFAKDMHFIYGREGIGNVREKNTIGIHAVRGGTIVGEHEVLFCGDDEIITLSHSARSKKIFAIGAIQAALFIHKKEAGLYNMQDILSTLFDIER